MRVYQIEDGPKGPRLRRKEAPKMEMVEIIPLVDLSCSVDGIHPTILEAGKAVEVPRALADAYLERGHATLPDAEIAPAPEVEDEPETPEIDAEADEDEDAADPDEDEASKQAAARAALMARPADELRDAAADAGVKVRKNASKDRIVAALLEAGVTLGD